MIEQTREAVARTVNAGMTLLYWRVGRRIQVEILKNQRAEYGGEILATLSQELTAEFCKRLIAIDLKLGDFKAEYKGQMELYLRWLAKHEQQPGEGPPLGLILCAGKKTEQIELLELDQSGIHVAEYLTALPPRELLQRKLHAAIEISRARLEAKKGDSP
jgi:hypothetical protein